MGNLFNCCQKRDNGRQITKPISLYEKYGGQETIASLVDNFYGRVLSDDIVKHFFNKTNMIKQKKHMTLFLSIALGAKKQWTGKAMGAVHQKMGLTDVHFNAVACDLKSTLETAGVTAEDVNTILQVVGGFRSEVVSA